MTVGVMGETVEASGPERRQLPRTLVSVPLSVFSGERVVLNARTVDLSPGGALLHGSSPVQVGEQVRVEVARGASRNPLSLAAEIVRIATPTAHRRQHGVALRFTEVSDIDVTILLSIIEQASRG